MLSWDGPRPEWFVDYQVHGTSFGPYPIPHPDRFPGVKRGDPDRVAAEILAELLCRGIVPSRIRIWTRRAE